MSDLSPEDLEIVKSHYYAMSKGRIARFVAREKENPSTISKALKTLIRNGHLSVQDLNKILLEVENETVEAFAIDASYVGRKERLTMLREELLH